MGDDSKEDLLPPPPPTTTQQTKPVDPWAEKVAKAEADLRRNTQILEDTAPTGLASDQTLSKRSFISGPQGGEHIAQPKVKQIVHAKTVMKKGIVHLIPLIAIGAILSVGSIGVGGVVRSQSISTSSVLASNSENTGKGNSENKGPSENSNRGKSQNAQTTTGGPGSNPGKSQAAQEDKKENPTAPIKANTGGQDTINPRGSDISTGGLTTEEAGQSTPSGTPGKKIRSQFPITVNPQTNEKTVTTPGGTKTIILPEVAIQNMIKAGFPVVLPPSEPPEGTPSATPEGTPSGTTESGQLQVTDEEEIALVEEDGQLAYEIPAVKNQKFLGVFDVKVKVKGIVNAENGEIIKLKKSIFDTILDFFSF